jgi:hypothetical protein
MLVAATLAVEPNGLLVWPPEAVPPAWGEPVAAWVWWCSGSRVAVPVCPCVDVVLFVSSAMILPSRGVRPGGEGGREESCLTMYKRWILPLRIRRALWRAALR